MREPTDQELIGGWEPGPLMSRSQREEILGRIARLSGLSRARQRQPVTYRCGGGCLDSGWVLVGETGRCTYRRCEVCAELGVPVRSKRRTRGSFE